MAEVVRIVAMTGEEWDRLRGVVSGHPAALAAVRAADIAAVEFEAPTTHDYVGSDGTVAASRPRTHVSIPLSALRAPRRARRAPGRGAGSAAAARADVDADARGR